ncbi:MAG: hypothetical protein EOO65_02665 [Methanosarcinales archaeon]|nr:MAG: hypothetical protein EOO65_02665 [Methanosarcinales archaeon]
MYGSCEHVSLVYVMMPSFDQPRFLHFSMQESAYTADDVVAVINEVITMIHNGDPVAVASDNAGVNISAMTSLANRGIAHARCAAHGIQLAYNAVLDSMTGLRDALGALAYLASSTRGAFVRLAASNHNINRSAFKYCSSRWTTTASSLEYLSAPIGWIRAGEWVAETEKVAKQKSQLATWAGRRHLGNAKAFLNDPINFLYVNMLKDVCTAADQVLRMAGFSTPHEKFMEQVRGFQDMLAKIHEKPEVELSEPIKRSEAFYSSLASTNKAVPLLDSVAAEWNKRYEHVKSGCKHALEKLRVNLETSIHLYALHNMALPWRKPEFNEAIKKAINRVRASGSCRKKIIAELEAYVSEWSEWGDIPARNRAAAVAYWKSAPVQEKYSNLAQTMIRALTIPVATVAVERGFSEQAYLDRNIYRQSMDDDTFLASLTLRCIDHALVDAALTEAIDAVTRSAPLIEAREAQARRQFKRAPAAAGAGEREVPVEHERKIRRRGARGRRV